MARKTDLAWCAGFFDGEGCVHITNLSHYGGTSRHVLRISVTQNKPSLLSHFQDVVGVLGSLETKDAGKCFQLVYAGVRAQKVLRLLEPYLVRKRKEALLAIRFQDLVQPGRNKPLTVKEQAQRFRFYTKVKDLKR